VVDAEVVVARGFGDVAGFPEKALADAMRIPLTEACRLFERAGVLSAAPAFEAALAAGAITGAHVEEWGRALRRLEPDQRVGLAADHENLAFRASGVDRSVFRKLLDAEVTRYQTDGGMSRYERQRAATRLWGGPERDGMVAIHARFDPLVGAGLLKRIDDMVNTLYSEHVPDGCPTDPIERQGFLRAHALAALVNGQGTGVGRPEHIIIEDHRGADAHGPVVDFGYDVHVPQTVVDDLNRKARHYRIIVNDGVIVSAPGVLDLGRSSRIANRDQRRVLRALYPTCAIAGCGTRFVHTDIHHVIWWEHGGLTNLDNMLPLCSRHHHDVHDNGWKLALTTDRTLTVTLPDGTIMTTGPPTRRAA
jgi:hypothetical protein